MSKRVLFQGDSITDVGRDRGISTANNKPALGGGYPRLITEQHNTRDDLSFFNRGISGDRIVDLYARWKVDALNLKPDVISILVGVNDVWHEYKSNNGVELERFNKVYRMLLDFTCERLPDTQLVICEPFILPCGVVDERWLEEMPKRQEIVRQIASDYQTTFVAFQKAFDDVLKSEPATYWAEDGVHPSESGHSLLAATWLNQVAL